VDYNSIIYNYMYKYHVSVSVDVMTDVMSGADRWLVSPLWLSDSVKSVSSMRPVASICYISPSSVGDISPSSVGGLCLLWIKTVNNISPPTQPSLACYKVKFTAHYPIKLSVTKASQVTPLI